MLAIGEFSRITHLSIRTLRHYHQVGLLEPAEIDPSSGYRHYTLGQVPIAQAIRRFRDLDMPVDRVREVLTAPDLAKRNELIAEHLGALEAKLAQTQAAVATLRGLLQSEPAPIAVEFRKVPRGPRARDPRPGHARRAGRLVARRARRARGDLRRAPPRAHGRARRHVRDGDLRARARRRHGVRSDRRRDAPRRPHRDGDHPRGRARGHPTPRPARRHRPDLWRARSVRQRHAIGVEGPVRESYLVDPRTPPAGWHTEIGWPVFGVR